MKTIYTFFIILFSFILGSHVVWGSQTCVGFYNRADVTNLRADKNILAEDSVDLNSITRTVLLKMQANQSIDTIYQELIVKLQSAARVQNEQEYSRLISEIGQKSPIENETGDRLSAYFERMKTLSRLVSDLKSQVDRPKLWRSKNNPILDFKKVEQIDLLFRTVEADRKHFSERRAHLAELAARYSDRYPVVQNLETATNRYLVLLISAREQLIEMGSFGGDVSRKVNILHGLLSTPIDGVQMRLQNLRLTLSLLEERAAQVLQLESVLTYQGNSPIEDVYVAGGFTLAESQSIAQNYRKFQSQKNAKAVNSLSAKWNRIKQDTSKFKKTIIRAGIVGLASMPIAGIHMHNQKIEDTFNSVSTKAEQKESIDVSPGLKYVLEHSIDSGSLMAAFNKKSFTDSLTKSDVLYLVRNMKFFDLETDFYVLNHVFFDAQRGIRSYSVEEATDLRNAIKNRPSFQKILPPRSFTGFHGDREVVLERLEGFIDIPGDEVSRGRKSSPKIKEAIIKIAEQIHDVKHRDNVLKMHILNYSKDLNLDDAIALNSLIHDSDTRTALLAKLDPKKN